MKKKKIKNVLPILEEEKITITKSKYDCLINEIGYLRGTKKTLIEDTITINIQEYKELLVIKGKYEELKEKRVLNINQDGIQIPI